jgi:alpha-N-arabinofuranosidase
MKTFEIFIVALMSGLVTLSVKLTVAENKNYVQQTDRKGNEQLVTLEIPSKLSGNLISPLLFGHNLEITRKASWQGLSAEMLANRKFAAVGANDFPLHWLAIGGCKSSVTLDSTIAYAGKYSVRVALSSDGGECGISQGKESVAIEQGRNYRLRIMIRANGPITAIVRIRKSISGSPLFEVKHNISSSDWQEIREEFTASVNEMSASFEVVGTGSGVFNIGAVSLQDANAFNGMRRDVIECLKAMHVKLLRFPGGCFSELYNWKDGLLPVDARPPIGPARGREEFILHNSDGYDMHEFGIDDFIALCHELGCEPCLTVRMGEGSPDEAAAWVEYCNGGNDTKWGKLRIVRGHNEPYNVRYWSLGNEISVFGKGESTNVERYGEMCNAFAKSMRSIDPKIRLIGSGMHGVHNLYPFNQEWSERILTLAGSSFDAYSYHEYIKPADNLSETAIAPLKATLNGLEGLRLTINKLAPSQPNKTIFFDEWNLWDAWNRTPGIQEALYTAVMLHMLCRDANRLGIEGSCYFQPVNEGAIRVSSTTSELTPVGRVFSMLATHAGNLPVKVKGETGPCDIFASLSQDGGSLIVTAINFEGQNNQVSIQVVGESNWGIGTTTDYAAISNAASSDVSGSEIEVIRSGNRKYSIVLPALSFAKIEFQITKSQ